VGRPPRVARTTIGAHIGATGVGTALGPERVPVVDAVEDQRIAGVDAGRALRVGEVGAVVNHLPSENSGQSPAEHMSPVVCPSGCGVSG